MSFIKLGLLKKKSKGNLKDDKNKKPQTPSSPRPEEKDDKKDEDLESYNHLVEKLEKKNTDVRDYENILREDDETSKFEAGKATEEDIKREITLLIGPVKEWSSESEEIIDFRTKIQRIRKETMAKSAGKVTKPTLPPVYVSSEPPPPTQPKKFFVKVNLVMKNAKEQMVKTVPCDGHQTAEEFAIFFIDKINDTHSFNKSPDDWIFKATGAAEYLYGKHKMEDFEHIRKCLKRGERVELNLMDKQYVLENTDQSTQVLKGVSYDFTDKSLLGTGYNHDRIKFEANSWDKMEVISTWDLQKPFKVKIIGVDNVQLILPPRKKHDKKRKHPINPEDSFMYVVAEVYHGGQVIGKARATRPILFSHNPRFNQYLEFPDLYYADLPREARIGITLYAGKYTEREYDRDEAEYKNDHYALAWLNYQVFNYKGELSSNPVSIGMYPNGVAKPTGQCVANSGDDYIPYPPVLQLEFEKFSLPVVIPSEGTIPEKTKERFEKFLEQQKQKYNQNNETEEEKAEKLAKLINTDPLYSYNEEERWRVWEAREELKTNPRALTKFLQSVNWGNPVAVRIAHDLLDEWATLESIDALELLDYNYADAKVRNYAIQRLNELDDNSLSDFILQLVQTLKYESYLDCALARFLLQRAIRSTHLIGHILFWHLKAEMTVLHVRERHGLLLEEYLSTCGGHRRELLKQNGVVDQLLGIAMKIKKVKKGEEQVRVLREDLTKLTLPPKFKLPLNPRLEVKGIIPQKCKVMDSAKFPLWLVFQNADETGSDVYIIFKAGDDLRQDLLTLQLMRIIDNLWKKEGMDLHMQPYGCISCGDGVGMIEVVLNSSTIADITHEYGGASAALSKEPLIAWLREKNPKPEQWPKVVENFVLSCAGYCVFTYILGIGDRHNDNIMLTKSGDLFHIDFGHFLGHFKFFHGIARETTPFIFDQMYAAVMGGEGSEDFQRYSELACRAYNICRKHGHMLISLLLLMLATGIPELTGLDDIMWLRKSLVLEKTEEQAKQHFQELIKKSLYNIRVKVNNLVHIVAHNYI